MKLALKEDIYRIDRLALEKYGIPAIVLMENAGQSFFDYLKTGIPSYKTKKYLVLCGSGNNGGDGAVVARKLFLDGCRVKAVLFGGPRAGEGPASVNFGIIRKMGVEHSDPASAASLLEESDVVIDALYGVGFHGEPREDIAGLIGLLNASGKTVVSVDMPSGVYADGGCASVCVKAGATVTFGLPKYGMVDYPGRQYAGRRVVCSINIPVPLLEDKTIAMDLAAEGDLPGFYRKRQADSHKGSYGHLLVVGGTGDGTPDMGGAVVLAALAALKAGAGLCTAAVCREHAPAVQANVPEAMTLALDENRPDESLARLQRYIEDRQIKTVLAGNGSGPGRLRTAVIRELLENKTVDRVILDAGALSELAENRELSGKLKGCGKEIILTPHIGEMARLTGKDSKSIKSGRAAAAKDFSRANGVVVVLKDAISVITDGAAVWLNEKGGPSLARGGSGDVLAGLTAGLAASGYTSLVAPVLGCWLLGRAGEIYAESRASVSALARDIICLVPDVFREIEAIIDKGADNE